MKHLISVLTKAQANLLLDSEQCTPVYIAQNMETNQFCFCSNHGIPVLLTGSSNWVPVTYYLPMTVEPRESLPSGLVSTLDELIAIFFKNDKLLEPYDFKLSYHL